ncbi:MAG: SUMF1/EgtB/PvdO family nonheme iron enzyme [Polyangiaceae bacterium]|nr:SUMF1/EgtB/PvdO family nonheme iron enzyme [Polyangiaceae bacterium]
MHAIGPGVWRLPKYPWGSNEPGANTNLAVYGCHWGPSGGCWDTQDIAPVGSVPAGNARWGHADMAGGMFEWARDAYGPYPSPCIDCARLSPLSLVTYRGGSLRDERRGHETATRVGNSPSAADDHRGVRCARVP